MELNSDVVGLILDLLGDRITLLSTRLRDGYFRKYGIWIKLGLYMYHPHFDFPEKFYSYPVNLCFDGIPFDRLSIIGLKNCIGHLYNADAVRLTNYVLEKTVFIQNTDIKNISHFSALRSVKNVTTKISDLAKRCINGVTIILENTEEYKELERLESFDYNIEFNIQGEKIPHNIASGVIECNNYHIDKNTIYPNLETIDLYEDEDDINTLNIGQFPKLKLVDCDQLYQDYFGMDLTGVVFDANYYEPYTPEMWEKINTSGAKLRLHLDYDFLDDGINKNKDIIPQISITYKSLYKIDIGRFIQFYTEIDMVILIDFDHISLLVRLLNDILSVAEQPVVRKIRIFGGPRNTIADMISIALRIYRKNKIFLDFNKLGCFTDRDLSDYWNIKKNLGI